MAAFRLYHYHLVHPPAHFGSGFDMSGASPTSAKPRPGGTRAFLSERWRRWTPTLLHARSRRPRGPRGYRLEDRPGRGGSGTTVPSMIDCATSTSRRLWLRAWLRSHEKAASISKPAR